MLLLLMLSFVEKVLLLVQVLCVCVQALAQGMKKQAVIEVGRAVVFAKQVEKVLVEHRCVEGE